MSLLVFFLILGLPVAALLAWAFEITPEGLKRDGGMSYLPTDFHFDLLHGDPRYEALVARMGLASD